ncbi:hypothetical protein E5S69_20665 [Cupriavidus necator]|uniref:hypothetical protein n=1 Tax=Cupriavidus necator TaxID=106590 RepID=UPI0014901A13|nr:hypothetical protein [Cupriavidus necator]NOV25918.1 hypothetical protein [Cupriavidus necator]
MGRNFTDAERLVAMAIVAKPTDTANDNDIEAGGYMRPIADAILRDDLSDAAMASLGRELLQVYLRDVIGLVLSTEREIDEEEAERATRTKRALAELPAAVTFRVH